MCDGITFKHPIKNFEAWKRMVDISFAFSVDDNGVIKCRKRDNDKITTHRATWETYDLIVKEVCNSVTGKTVFHLTVKGSLHKNEQSGNNYLPFTWQQLQRQIDHVCKCLFLEPGKARIAILEIGVNIVTPFVVMPFLWHNVVNYKGHLFNRYDPDEDRIVLGLLCKLTHYHIKIYDKAEKSPLDINLMRFEKRFVVMQELNKLGIKYLADLLVRKKVEPLLKQLIDSWNGVLIYDIPDLKSIELLNKKNEDLLTEGQYPKYWEQLKLQGNRAYYYQLEKFKNLVDAHGSKWHKQVKELIVKEWQQLFDNCTNLKNAKKGELYKSIIKIKDSNVQNRYCHSCGRDITHQRNGSKTCSETLYGREGKQCRNKNSNPRNNFKNKIDKIQRRGVLFDILPYFIDNNNKKQSYAI